MSNSNNPPIQLPARISKYELLEFLGGGMSHVFRAKDTVLGRTVAIKILTPAGVADSDTKARFLQEARTASNISHENILAVYDFGEEAGKPYMVMEFLRGRTLRAAIHEGLMKDLPTKLRIAAQMARALAFVHQNQIIHRDVKPENINLDDSGRAKLMDFGIAKLADLSLTQPGYVLGTPYYMAPEQIMGKPVTPSVDIYAFGIMLYEMLLGTRPYGGETIETIFYKIMNEPLDLSPLAKAGVPPAVVAIVARCTKKDASARYDGFGGIVTDLENALGTQLAPRQPDPKPGPPATSSSKMPLFAGIGMAAAALALAGFFWFNHNPPAPPVIKKTETKTEQPDLEPRMNTSSGYMRLVKGGAFLMGEHKVEQQVPTIYIDEYEVSNQYYADFCSATHHDLPKNFDAAHPHLPVIDITVADARAYATWAQKRLPTGKEWEKAARGATGNTYPWGDANDPSHANLLNNPTLTTHTLLAVDALPLSASPYEVLNMVGNVWEMIDEPYTPKATDIRVFNGRLSPAPTATEPWITARGGSYTLNLDPALVWDVFPIPERFHSELIGFRCVKDVK